MAASEKKTKHLPVRAAESLGSSELANITLTPLATLEMKYLCTKLYILNSFILKIWVLYAFFGYVLTNIIIKNCSPILNGDSMEPSPPDKYGLLSVFFRFLWPLRSMFWCHGSARAPRYCYWWIILGLSVTSSWAFTEIKKMFMPRCVLLLTL